MDVVNKLQEIQEISKSDPEQAIQALHSILTGDGESENSAKLIQGCLLFMQSKFNDAAKEFAAVIDVDAKNETASQFLFHSYWVSKQPIPALKEIKRFWLEFGAEHNSPLALEYRKIAKEVRAAVESGLE